MSIMPPIFPVPEPHHYSDYGFDPQIDYFQVLEEARRHSKRAEPRPIDAIHFKLSKPISKDNDRAKSKKRKQWWKSALGFLKRTKGGDGNRGGHRHRHQPNGFGGEVTAPTDQGCFYPYRAVSGPVYATEPVSGRSTPCRTSRSAASSGLLRAAEVGEAAVATPYVSLRELNCTDGHRNSAFNAPTSMPIYLVT